MCPVTFWSAFTLQKHSPQYSFTLKQPSFAVEGQLLSSSSLWVIKFNSGTNTAQKIKMALSVNCSEMCYTISLSSWTSYTPPHPHPHPHSQGTECVTFVTFPYFKGSTEMNACW